MKSGRLDGFPGFQLPMSDCRQLSSAESHFQLLLQTSKILRRRRGIVRDISEMPGCFNVSAILSNCFTMFLVSTLLRGHVLSSFFSSSVCLSSLCLLAGFGGVGGDVNVLLHFHAYVMLRCCTSSCTSTHTSCYEREQLSLLMVAKLGKEPPINKCQKNASNGKTLPTTAVSL